MTTNPSDPVSSTDRTERGGEAWGALDTHYAAEAAGIRGLPAPIIWTALHKFAEEVARAASKRNAINAELLEALREVAQSLAWLSFGECRGFSDNLLTSNTALEKARAAIAKATS